MSDDDLFTEINKKIRKDKQERLDLAAENAALKVRMAVLEEENVVLKAEHTPKKKPMTVEELAPVEGRKVIFTPIAKLNKPDGEPDSKKAYEDQLQRTARGETWMWDDARFNEANVGDLFGFVFNNERLVFHRVNEVLDPTHRLYNWSSNVGMQSRNVLLLSEPFGKSMTWNQWLDIGGYKIQGTMYAKRGGDIEQELLKVY